MTAEMTQSQTVKHLLLRKRDKTFSTKRPDKWLNLASIFISHGKKTWQAQLAHVSGGNSKVTSVMKTQKIRNNF